MILIELVTGDELSTLIILVQRITSCFSWWIFLLSLVPIDKWLNSNLYMSKSSHVVTPLSRQTLRDWVRLIDRSEIGLLPGAVLTSTLMSSNDMGKKFQAKVQKYFEISDWIKSYFSVHSVRIEINKSDFLSQTWARRRTSKQFRHVLKNKNNLVLKSSDLLYPHLLSLAAEEWANTITFVWSICKRKIDSYIWLPWIQTKSSKEPIDLFPN